MSPSRTTIVLAVTTLVAGSFDEVLTRTPAPSRELRLTRAPVEWLVDGKTGTPPEGTSTSSLRVNAYRSEVPGPEAGGLARIDVEGGPSPVTDSLLLRISVQVRRTGPSGVALRNGWVRVSFFSSEAAQWQRVGPSGWQPAEEPVEFVLDELSRGDTRMFFLHVDALQRFGSGLGIVEVGGVDGLTGAEVRLRAPLARHAIHRASITPRRTSASSPRCVSRAWRHRQSSRSCSPIRRWAFPSGKPSPQRCLWCSIEMHAAPASTFSRTTTTATDGLHA